MINTLPNKSWGKYKNVTHGITSIPKRLVLGIVYLFNVTYVDGNAKTNDVTVIYIH